MKPNAVIEATPAKLRDGSWGARIACAATKSAVVNVGDPIRITTKAGKTWSAYVERVVARFDDAVLVATHGADPKPRTQYRGRGISRGGWCRCGNHEDPMSMGFGRYAGQIITCPDCGGNLDVS